MENNMEKIKEIIKEYYSQGDCGLYFSRNIAGDYMDTIYYDGRVTIDICYHYSYFEIFGLTPEEKTEISKFYSSGGRD